VAVGPAALRGPAVALAANRSAVAGSASFADFSRDPLTVHQDLLVARGVPAATIATPGGVDGGDRVVSVAAAAVAAKPPPAVVVGTMPKNNQLMQSGSFRKRKVGTNLFFKVINTL